MRIMTHRRTSGRHTGPKWLLGAEGSRKSAVPRSADPPHPSLGTIVWIGPLLANVHWGGYTRPDEPSGRVRPAVFSVRHLREQSLNRLEKFETWEVTFV